MGCSQVSEAVCLSNLSYHEAWELSYFGASVLHPRTTMPAMKYDIPITIRNFFNRDMPGELPNKPRLTILVSKCRFVQIGIRNASAEFCCGSL